MWLTAQQGFLVGLLFLGCWPVLRKWAPKFAPAAVEAFIVMALYTLWRLIGYIDYKIIINDAMRRGRWIWHFERAIGLGNERWLQQRLIDHGWVIQFFNGYYALIHVPAMIAFLTWLYFRHRERYSPWRSTLALSTACDVFIRRIPVSPPRFFPEFGFVDSALKFKQSVYGPQGTGISNQLAAMPSIHVGWAVLVAVAMWRYGNRTEKTIGIVHGILTCLAVVVTANHWWLDGIVASALMIPCWLLWTRGSQALKRLSGRAELPLASVPTDVLHDAVR
jgi:PAP2 superfamily